MAKKTMVLNFKDDAYFYKFNEQSRINEVLYQIRETINSNFRGLPFVTDISYYLKRNENSYDYVATITYETDDEPKPTLVLIKKNRKFTMNVGKMDYENYNEVFTELKSSIEKQLYREVDKYFSEHPDYTVTKKEAEWTETDDSDTFTIVVTYTAPYNAEQEKVTPAVIDECLYLWGVVMGRRKSVKSPQQIHREYNERQKALR